MSQLPRVLDLQATALSATAIRLTWKIPDIQLGSGYAMRSSFRIFRRRQVLLRRAAWNPSSVHRNLLRFCVGCC